VESELSSVELRVLVREIKGILAGARVDKVYQVGERELVVRLYGRGSLEFVAAPNFMCVTRYRRPSPRQPSSFAMQLRKNLKGEPILDVSQHGFDRIVEVVFPERILVFELFSKGNVILCDSDHMILGLLDWQKWRHRTLGVGRAYEYPPEVANPFNVNVGDFADIMSSSDKGVASTLATRFSLGGYYAERVCAQANTDPKAGYGEIDGAALFEAFTSFIGDVDGAVDARLVDGRVVPFGETGGVHYDSFNDAVDDYYSTMQVAEVERESESKLTSERERLERMLAKQGQALERAREGVECEKSKGDLLYQRMSELNEVAKVVREGRGGDLGDDEIMAKLGDYGFARGLEGYKLTLEL
jgi:predicted ribosome quality control (RQC) complex YloA/Tae2 family protein